MGKAFISIVLTFIMVLAYVAGNAQARSGIGVGLGVNVPFATGYSPGIDLNVQGNIRLNNRFALVPSLGVKQIKGDNAIIHEGYQGYSSYTRGDLGGIALAFSVKYYFSDQWFTSAGIVATIHPDRSSSGGTLALGYQVPIDNKNNVEFNLNGTLLTWSRTSGSTHVPVAGLRVAYNFDFRSH
ncbi:hypothetical protein SNE25_03825 [Mucilaginibacter sabulilitoris]|uniref:Outer membrane protein beta-barrel domain-containing protein n=1 Tax=Mucilaginibacter sabulilitoris TaxID=1173583 RepID=A0ABZ0TNB5_9SPHI|nr:hypothetical protein [Mucilaginibacter sabulilitoris]WPU94649.1 hypothetical protein SNE25_03825 [Mucilaginibacter sabulilitoris]